MVRQRLHARPIASRRGSLGASSWGKSHRFMTQNSAPF